MLKRCRSSRTRFVDLYSDGLRELRKIAKTNLKLDFLRRYVCKKYQMPPTDPRYLAFTPEELWLEYLEDFTERSPDKVDEAFAPSSTKEATKYVTKDEVFNEVEDAAAAGDFDEVRRMVESWDAPKSAEPAPVVEEEFSDQYG